MARNPTDKRASRAEQLRLKRREQVLRCAERVFSRKGYHATGVGDIIEEAGVARGTFYLYFESKRAIFDELLDRLLARLTSSVKRIDVSAGAPPPFEQLLDNVRRVVKTLHKHREMTRILLHGATGIDPEFDEKLTACYARLRQLIEGALVAGAQMGLVRPCNPTIASLCALGTVKEVIYYYFVAAPHKSVDLDALAHDLLEYNLKGIFHWPPAS